MFEVAYYNISTQALTSASVAVVNAEEVLKYLEKNKNGIILIKYLKYGDRFLDIPSLCKSLKFE